MSGKPAQARASNERERPKIYVTANGARYVKADELLRSKRGRAAVEKMAKLTVNRRDGEARPQGRDGRWRDSDTVSPGNDSHPPKDEKH